MRVGIGVRNNEFSAAFEVHECATEFLQRGEVRRHRPAFNVNAFDTLVAFCRFDCIDQDIKSLGGSLRAAEQLIQRIVGRRTVDNGAGQLNSQNRIVRYGLFFVAGGQHDTEHHEKHEGGKGANAANTDDNCENLLQKTFHRGEKTKEYDKPAPIELRCQGLPQWGREGFDFSVAPAWWGEKTVP